MLYKYRTLTSMTIYMGILLIIIGFISRSPEYYLTFFIPGFIFLILGVFSFYYKIKLKKMDNEGVKEKIPRKYLNQNKRIIGDCPKCASARSLGLKICPDCGKDFKIKKRKI